MNVRSSASLQAPTGKETPTQCGRAIICFPSFCPLSKKPPVLQGCAIIGFHPGTHQKRSLPLAEDLRSSYFPRLPARKTSGTVQTCGHRLPFRLPIGRAASCKARTCDPRLPLGSPPEKTSHTARICDHRLPTWLSPERSPCTEQTCDHALSFCSP